MPNEVRFRGAWEPMRVVREPIAVKGQAPRTIVELKFTRHGPIFYEDTRAPPRVRAAVGAARAGHRAVSGRPSPRAGDATAGSSSTRRCTGRRRPRT